jgi:hypothetical protein
MQAELNIAIADTHTCALNGFVDPMPIPEIASKAWPGAPAAPAATSTIPFLEQLIVVRGAGFARGLSNTMSLLFFIESKSQTSTCLVSRNDAV